MLETRLRNTSTVATSGGGGAGTPGGSNTQVQYNNNSAFGGITNATTDGTTLTITSGVLASNTQIGGATGIQLSAAAGVLTIAGIGNVNNENITVDFETNSNQINFGTTTGVNVWSLFSGAITLRSSASGSSHVNATSTVAGTGTAIIGQITGSSATASTIATGGKFTGIKSSTTGGNTLTAIGVSGVGQYSSTGTQADAIGVYGIAQKITSASGAISDAYSIYGDLPTAAGGGSITRSWAGGFNGNIWINGNLYVGSAASTATTLTLPTSTDTLVARATTDTLTNKRITQRVVTAADGTSVTPNTDNADVTYQLNTQAGGTLTINADGGTPTNGQKWIFKINSTNAQTYAWNAVYVGGVTVVLPTASTAGKIDQIGFIYDTVNSKWECVAVAAGY